MVIGLVAAFVVAGVLLTVAAEALLLTFGGILFGCGLRGSAAFLKRKTGLPLAWGITLCTAVFVITCLLAIFVGGPHLAQESTALGESMKDAVEKLREIPAGREVLKRLSAFSEDPPAIMSRALGVLGSVTGFLGAFVYIFFVALYTASAPGVYERGTVRLFPVERRPQVRELLDQLGRTLQRWLMGRAISMVAVAVTTWLGLVALGVPLPGTLAIIAGLLVFIPNIGPVVATGPALLLGLLVSPMHFFYVGTLYLLIAIADGYGLTPWIQERAVSIPPALVLIAQVVFGALWGTLGVAFSTPLIACLVIIVRRLYVEDTLERPTL